MEWLPKLLDDLDAAWYAARQRLADSAVRRLFARIVFALIAAALIVNPFVRWSLLAAIAAFACAELGYRLAVALRPGRRSAH